MRDNEQMNGIWRCQCGSYNIKVVDSRQNEDGSIRRTRLCEDCMNRVYTREVTRDYIYEFETALKIEAHVKALKRLLED